MPYYIYAWIGTILLGFYAIIAKLTGKYKITNPSQFSFFATLFGGFITISLALFNGAGWPKNWTFIILAGLSLAISNLIYLVVVKKLDITILSPLFNLKSVITVLLGYFFLGEILTTRMIFLIGMITIAGVFATMDERFSPKSFLNKNIMLGIFLMFFVSIQVLLINRAMSQNDYWTGMMWMVIVSIIFSFGINFPRFYKDLKKTKIKDYSGVVLLAIFGGLSDLAVYKAFEGNVGVSTIIFSLPVSMVLSLFFVFWKPDLLEKHTFKVYMVRFAAAVVMILGAMGLSK